jgi:hypothetical protein
LCGFIAIVEEEKMINDDSVNIEADTANDTANVNDTEQTVINTVIVENIAEPTARIVNIEMFDPDAVGVETSTMKDKSVKYNTKSLSKKSQKIYENLPPIVDSININKVSKNMMKVPNKILSKRLARIQRGLVEGEDDDDDY